MTPRLAFAAATLLMLGGCASTFNTRITLAETCQEVLDKGSVPPAWADTRAVLRARIGMNAMCAAGQGQPDKLIMECALDDIERRFAIYNNGDRFATVKAASVEFSKAVHALEFEQALGRAEWAIRAAVERCPPATPLRCVSPELVTKVLGDLRTDLLRHLPRIYETLTKLRHELALVANALTADAAAELAAWDANVRAQLAGFERALAGDARTLVTDASRNELLRYAARRSLDMLHRALRPADAALNKADEKVYGAVSLSYVSFGGSIQESVGTLYEDTVEKFTARLRETSPDAEALTNDFRKALQRAACENISSGTEYTILTELVDTMFAMKATKSIRADRSESSAATVTGAPLRYAALATVPFQFASLNYARGGGGGGGTAPDDPFTPISRASTPVQVYVTHEWAARRHILLEQIRAGGKPVDHEGKRAFPEPVTADETLVTRLAESAAALAIDDQLRASPQMLVTGTGLGGISLSGAIQSVNQVNAVLSNIVNVSNVNTFAPNNNVAPVVNVYQKGQESVANLCADGRLPAHLASCSSHGTGYTLRLKAYYDTGSCETGNVQRALSELGGAVRDFALATRQTFHAHISGYTSLRRAGRAPCNAAPDRHGTRCVYFNLAREPVDIGQCTPSAKPDANTLLSARRAGHAARALEAVADGSVLVTSLAAKGAEGARLRDGDDDVDEDRTVVIRLWPSERRRASAD